MRSSENSPGLRGRLRPDSSLRGLELTNGLVQFDNGLPQSEKPSSTTYVETQTPCRTYAAIGKTAMNGGRNERLASVRKKLLRAIAVLRQRLPGGEPAHAARPPRHA